MRNPRKNIPLRLDNNIRVRGGNENNATLLSPEWNPHIRNSMTRKWIGQDVYISEK